MHDVKGSSSKHRGKSFKGRVNKGFSLYTVAHFLSVCSKKQTPPIACEQSDSPVTPSAIERKHTAALKGEELACGEVAFRLRFKHLDRPYIPYGFLIAFQRKSISHRFVRCLYGNNKAIGRCFPLR